MYPVHTSAEFIDKLKKDYPFVRRIYVPAGCTPVAQVLDLIVNRPFKHHVKTGFHNFLVEELQEQLRDGKGLEELVMPDEEGVVSLNFK